MHSRPELPKRSIQKHLTIAIAAMVLPLVISTVGGYFFIHYTFSKMDKAIDETIEKMSHITDIQLLILQSGIPAHHYLIHGDPAERKNFRRIREVLDAKFSVALDAYNADPEEGRLLRESEQYWESVKQFSQEILSLEDPAPNGSGASVMEIMDGLLEKSAVNLSNIHELTAKGIDSLHKNSHAKSEQLELYAAIILLCSLLLVQRGIKIVRREVHLPIKVLTEGIQEFKTGNLNARVELNTNDELGRMAAAFNNMADVLTERERELEHLASHDELTELCNVREFRRLLQIELERSARHNRPFSLLLLDIDHFKLVNDNYGHLAGDKVLHQIGLSIKAILRPSDLGARYGGEEFAIILPETDMEMACTVAERIRGEIASWNICIESVKKIRVTVSIGVATYPEDGIEPAALISRVDERLYTAKELGRNRVISAVPAVDPIQEAG